jgi:hypothetical protein
MHSELRIVRLMNLKGDEAEFRRLALSPTFTAYHLTFNREATPPFPLLTLAPLYLSLFFSQLLLSTTSSLPNFFFPQLLLSSTSAFHNFILFSLHVVGIPFHFQICPLSMPPFLSCLSHLPLITICCNSGNAWRAARPILLTDFPLQISILAFRSTPLSSPRRRYSFFDQDLARFSPTLRLRFSMMASSSSCTFPPPFLRSWESYLLYNSCAYQGLSFDPGSSSWPLNSAWTPRTSQRTSPLHQASR